MKEYRLMNKTHTEVLILEASTESAHTVTTGTSSETTTTASVAAASETATAAAVATSVASTM
jgi:hypothetical protein